MRSKLAAVALLATLCAARSAGAEGGLGHWTVSGRVAGLAFTLNCKFEQAGQNLGGVCIDGSTSDPKIKGSRRHVLTKGHVDGNQITWTYVSSFLLSHFNVDFSGDRRGDHMTGQILVQNRAGTFSADRSGP